MKKLIFLLLGLMLISCGGGDDEDVTPIQVTPEPVVIEKFTLTISATEGGSVDTAEGSFDAGTSVNLTATPQNGYVFSGWSGDSDSNENSISITVNGNLTFTANFSLVDVNTGFLIEAISSRNYKIYKTIDSGDTWNLVDDVNLENNWLSLEIGEGIQFVDANTGFLIEAISSRNYKIYKTIDSGDTWNLVDDVNLENNWLSLEIGEGIQFVDANTGFLIEAISSRNYKIYKTIDSGDTWNLVDDVNLENNWLSPEIGEGIQFVDANTGFLIEAISSRNYKIYKTIDSGDTWNLVDDVITVNRLSPEIGEGIQFVDANTGFLIEAISSRKYEIYKTIDSGDTWNLVDEVITVNRLSPEIGEGIQFVDVNTGFLIEAISSRNYKIYKTIDSGDTWNLVDDVNLENNWLSPEIGEGIQFVD